ncbi:MAG: type II secretion system protein [Geobacteraceae bacterium]|nr:type II secretion system protein [Geobacteraceae bacterium]
MNFLWGKKGVTLLELIIAISILTILVAGIVPLTRMTAKRTREIELRQNLRIMRTAIDTFKKSYDKAVDDKKIVTTANKSGYPETLRQLVDGYDFGGLYAYKKRFLRKIPIDPMNPPEPGEEPQWGLRSYSDEPDTPSWGGEDVYDVYSLSKGTALDGTKYREW